MKLDKRLSAVSVLAGKAKVIADIGSDHAYLPAYMLLEGNAEYAIVSDVNEGPLENGRNTCRQAGVYDKCDFRLGSGLSVLEQGEADVITLCGMGGELMKMLLENDLAVAKSAKRLVLQPQSAYDDLRGFLDDNGFGVIDEAIVCDRHLYYRIILCSCEHPVKRDDSLYPTLLAERKDETYREFLNFRLGICEGIISKVKDSGKNNKNTIDSLSMEIGRIREVLKLYED